MKLISGLGNQLFQYAVGRHLSLKHNVPLKFDAGFFSTQKLRSFKLDKFNINAEIATEKETNKFLFLQTDLGLRAKIYRKAEKMIPRNKRRYFKEREWWAYDPDLFETPPEVYLDGYWQHYKYFENLDPVVIQELTLKEKDKESEIFKNNISKNYDSVSIHIRRGDYTTDGLMGVLPLSYYLNAISLMNQKLAQPSYYIFSDDLDWARDNLNIDGQVSFVDIGQGQREFAELDLMSKCRHNIIANSSFSWWGAFMNSNPEKIVISPVNWVLRPEINQRIKLQFPSWIKT